jgi:hypothetical protein
MSDKTVEMIIQEIERRVRFLAILKLEKAENERNTLMDLLSWITEKEKDE